MPATARIRSATSVGRSVLASIVTPRRFSEAGASTAARSLKKTRKSVFRELWEELLELVEACGHVVDFKKVVGHADKLGRTSDSHESYNQRCDQLAVAAIAVG